MKKLPQRIHEEENEDTELAWFVFPNILWKVRNCCKLKCVVPNACCYAGLLPEQAREFGSACCSVGKRWICPDVDPMPTAEHGNEAVPATAFAGVVSALFC